MLWRTLSQNFLSNASSCPLMKHVFLNVDRLFNVFPETKFQVQIFMFSKYHHKPHSRSVVDVGEGFFPRDKLIMYILFCCMPIWSFPSPRYLMSSQEQVGGGGGGGESYTYILNLVWGGNPISSSVFNLQCLFRDALKTEKSKLSPNMSNVQKIFQCFLFLMQALLKSINTH